MLRCKRRNVDNMMQFGSSIQKAMVSSTTVRKMVINERNFCVALLSMPCEFFCFRRY